MPATRRTFLHSAAIAAAGLAGTATGAGEQTAGAPPAQGGRAQQPAAPPKPVSEIHVPTMKFGKVEISRLVCGCNCFYGFAHFNQTLGTVMQEYYTPERVCDVLHQCNRFGINSFNYYPAPRAQKDYERFLAEGGKMHLIVQGNMDNAAAIVAQLKPAAVYRHGEMTDRAYQEGQLDSVREWCKKVRDLGVMVGVGTHKPEVIATVEEQGWDVDFFAGCVYNRTRSQDEWRKVLGGELVEMQGECYLQSDPPRMYKVMRATSKPCFAFKIMAAGRVGSADQAFKLAYESIKPNDGVFIGLFPRVKDEVRENAERVHRLLVKA
jgi:hypothetical protein